MLSVPPIAPVTSHCHEGGHFVRFYDDEALLADEIAQHLLAALAQGGGAMMIATPERAADVLPRLRAALAPAALARCLALDAADTLAQVMVDGWPDADRFDAAVGSVVRTARAAGAPLHAYGEMVALLCADGRYEAAVRLEQLWNGLAEQTTFALFCAYPWQLFPTVELANSFAAICQAHTHACSQKQPGVGTVSRADQFYLLELERKALALDAEVARRHDAERKAASTEADLADFLDNAAEGIHRVGADGTILWANQAELALLGYRWEEYVGHHIARFHVDPPVIDHILATLLRGGTLYDQPARLRCKDGSIRHVTIHSNGCFENGQLRYTRCFTRDATERHERDLALAQRDQMILRAPVATALLSGPELRYRLVNERYGALTGDAALQGKTLAEASQGHGEGLLYRLVRDVATSGIPFSAEELCLPELAPAERQRYFRLSLEPLSDVDGATDSVIVVAVDVTEHVLARKTMEQARDEREAILTALTEANRNKDQFLAMLGHELRNPLSPILLALEMMELRNDTGALRERQLIRRQVDHLVRLVDDLLDIARVTQGKVALRTGVLQVRDILDRALEIASAELQARAHEVTLVVEPHLQVDGDAARLAQVFANLLINAARYTPHGGRIRLSATAAGAGQLRIAVTDNGRGMSAHELRQAFELFYQGERGLDRAEGGLGVGLALARRLIELHRGRIEASSDGPGAGSEFVVWLPAAKAGLAHAAPPAATAIPHGGPRMKILLVDDNVDAVRLLGMLLTQHGHAVTVCHDPAAALAQADALRPDLAVLDIGLPLMSGHELGHQLRASPGNQHCRLIALSGYGQPDDVARSLAAGFEAHLVKPVAPEQLLAMLHRRTPVA